MGAELVSSPSPNKGGESKNDSAPLVSYTEQFYLYLPFYLSIGMTYDQYWNEDCCLVKYYREAFKLQRDRNNEQLWLQGMYIYEAFCDVSPILNAFAKKGTKPLPYPTQPYAITKEEAERRRVEKEKAEYEKMKAKTAAFASMFNASLDAQRREVENGE